MEKGKVLVFDIEAQFGFFKISEVTRATISFPFTRTALIGLIGAILGKNRNSYWNEESSLSKSLIGLEIIKPINHMAFTVNYSHTKITINIAKGALSTYLPCQTGKGKNRKFLSFVTNVRLDYLKNIHFRLYFYSEDIDLYEELKKRLIQSDFYYPPYLGHANLLADVIFLGESNLSKVTKIENNVDSVIPIDYIDPEYLNIIDAKFSIIKDIPIKFLIKDNEITNVYKTGFLIQTKTKEPIKIKLRPDSPIFYIGYPKNEDYSQILNWEPDTNKTIAFMPHENS